MFWIVILIVAAFLAYKFMKKGATSSSQGSAQAEASSIWAGVMSVPAGKYGNGKIWAGSSTLGIPAGLYHDGKIWKGNTDLGSPVGRYGDGKIWEGVMSTPIGHYGDGKVWEGVMTTPIATYNGDGEGAAAAALVLRIIHAQISARSAMAIQLD